MAVGLKISNQDNNKENVMTGYAILFEDNVNCSDQRDKYMNDYLKFLEANSINIISADPFWPTGLRKSLRILHWRQVFRDGAGQV